jgi:hypothetical protein
LAFRPYRVLCRLAAKKSTARLNSAANYMIFQRTPDVAAMQLSALILPPTGETFRAWLGVV